MMVWWRFKHNAPGPWRFGFLTQVDGPSGLVRMGHWNGDTRNGPVVDPREIETKPYG